MNSNVWEDLQKYSLKGKKKTKIKEEFAEKV